MRGARPWLWGVIALLASLGLGPGQLRAAELRAAEPAPRYEELVTGGAEPDARLPMIVVLHGRGGGAGRLRAALRQLDVPARVVLPRGSVRLHDGRPAWFGPRANGRAHDEVAGAVGVASEELHGYRGGHEPDAAVVRDVRRRVAAEARRLHASPGCAR